MVLILIATGETDLTNAHNINARRALTSIAAGETGG
jgi:hypothetical protein